MVSPQVREGFETLSLLQRIGCDESVLYKKFYALRLGVKSPKDAAILNTLPVVDKQLGVVTPNGEFWHRYNFDGYGETAIGAPWTVTQPNTFQTHSNIS